MLRTSSLLGLGSILGLGSKMTQLMFIWSMYNQFFPYRLRVIIERYVCKLMGFASNSMNIKFNEYSEEGGLTRSESYNSIRNYLASNSIALAKRLKASETRNTTALLFSMDDQEEVEDKFRGVKVKWSLCMQAKDNGGKRYFSLSFHEKHKELIIESYLDHVLKKGKEIGLNNRERKLYTNKSSIEYSGERWRSVAFHHPATFETLAMDHEKKEKIKNDLIKFSKGKDYYKKVGKPWKRGYLLYGPPGTGKSTMISAMANFLGYDVYDVELTTVKDNSMLKTLMLDTRGKSIIVIEDIDCSLEFKRKKKEEERKKSASEKYYEDRDKSKVTLSGLLNAIDGLWSACSDEKIMVFTTNFVDKLDPALIRRGRMDNHIEMSYCRFEAFQVLAKNYLDIESHDLYGEIKRLLVEKDMSPADVAENLMPSSDEDDADICLKRLIMALEEEKDNGV